MLTSTTSLTYGIICPFVPYCTKISIVPIYQRSVLEPLFSNLQHPAHKHLCENLNDSLSCQMAFWTSTCYVPGCGINVTWDKLKEQALLGELQSQRSQEKPQVPQVSHLTKRCVRPKKPFGLHRGSTLQ